MENKAATAKNISTLRVAKAELTSGDTSGKVYMMLSEGGVAFLTKRSVAEARVDKMIQQEVARQPVEEPTY
jgi:hypothetical protein